MLQVRPYLNLRGKTTTFISSYRKPFGYNCLHKLPFMDSDITGTRGGEEADAASEIERISEKVLKRPIDDQLQLEGSSSKHKKSEERDFVISDNRSGEEVDDERSVPVTLQNASTSAGPSSQRKKEKAKRNVGRRRRETHPQGEGEWMPRSSRVSADGEVDTKEARLPKRMCALLMGYCGAGFRGMQIQPGVRTVEGTLFEALAKAGAVSKDNSNDLTKVSFQRAARTDAGVHAAGNVVSLKMITEVPGVPDMTARINTELPPEIRVWSFVRVQNSFNARLSCDSRKYTYYFPSYLIIPPKPSSGLYRTFLSATENAHPAKENHDFWKDAQPDSSPEQDSLRKKLWRTSAQELAALRSAAKKYEGTHNYHNFTVERDFKDRANNRFMKQLEVSEPEVHNGVEWIRVLFHGQSFMYNQIRKMMFALIMICRTGTAEVLFDELYGPKRVHIPKMPALGLLLDEPVFESYNDRIAAANTGVDPSKPEYRYPISFESHREAIEVFKQEQVFSRMRAAEEKYQIFDRWIRSVDAYAGPDLQYLNVEGKIPDTAVIKKGEKRLNPFKEKRQFDNTDFSVNSDELESGVGVDIVDEIDEEEIDKSQLAQMEG